MNPETKAAILREAAEERAELSRLRSENETLKATIESRGRVEELIRAECIRRREERDAARAEIGDIKRALENVEYNGDRARERVRELEGALRKAIERIEVYAPTPGHGGSCTPESGCDAICMDVSYFSQGQMELRRVLSPPAASEPGGGKCWNGPGPNGESHALCPECAPPSSEPGGGKCEHPEVDVGQWFTTCRICKANVVTP